MLAWGKKAFDPSRFDAAWERYLAAIEKGHAGFRGLFAAGAALASID